MTICQNKSPFIFFVTTFSEDTSDIIKVINDTVESEKIINM